MRLLRSLFAWRNLSLQAKQTMLFILLIAVTALMVGSVRFSQRAGNEALTSVTQDTFVATERMSRVQVAAAELAQIESQLLAAYSDPGPEMDANAIFADYNAAVDDIMADLAEIEARLNADSVRTQVRTYERLVENRAEMFNDLQVPVTDFAAPESGAADSLEAAGDAIARAVNDAYGGFPSATGGGQLVEQAALLESIEESLVVSSSAQDLLVLQNTVELMRQIYTDMPESQQTIPLPDLLDDYLDEAGRTAVLGSTIQAQGAAISVERDLAAQELARLNTLVGAETAERLDDLQLVNTITQIIALGALTILVIASISAVRVFGASITRSLRPLVETASALEAGDLRARANDEGDDEFALLAASFNNMAVQLEGLIGGLEQRVSETTRNLNTTADIGRAVVEVRDPRDLMDQVVELIRQRFNFYHAQVFLVDDENANANLVASTGTAGRELLARRHSLPVGSQSVIGQVTEKGEPVVALDTSTDPTHRRNELLPDTRSELAIPMRIGDQVIGALDVQSVAPNAFDENTIAVFQLMADQLAVAIENARLFNQLEEARARLEAVQQRQTQESWRTYRQQRAKEGAIGYALEGGTLAPHTSEDAVAPLGEAIRTGQVIHHRLNGEAEIAIPIRVRGEVVGAFGFVGGSIADLGDDDLVLVEAIMDRVGLALENLRLIEQTSRRAEYEQIVNEITAKIVGSTDVDFILQTTVQELGRVLRAPQTSVRLRR